jgi:hypothetical protein
MSDHYIGLNKGQSGFASSDFAVGTSSGSTNVEVCIADAAVLTKADVILILDRIRDRINMSGLAEVLTNARV